MFLTKREGCIPLVPSYDTSDINTKGMTTALVFWCVFLLLH